QIINIDIRVFGVLFIEFIFVYSIFSSAREASTQHLLNLWFRARRAWRDLCARSEATAQIMTKKISG
ncbi:MAG TPA: hypothetical protein VJ861_09430, partial [Treponemataceae bacterium]|nr:hypothetical protein [Treponemataceae bacterium]